MATPSVNAVPLSENRMRDRLISIVDIPLLYDVTDTPIVSQKKEREPDECGVKKIELDFKELKKEGQMVEIHQLGGRRGEVSQINAMAPKSLNNNSISGHVYSLPHGIEVICEKDDGHGIMTVKSNSHDVYLQVSRGCDKIVLWNNVTMTNPNEDKKSFKKSKRKLAKHITRIFEKKINGFHSMDYGEYEVKTRSMNQCQISCYKSNCFQPIVFHPLAFFKDGQRSGGAYFNVSSTSPRELEKKPLCLKKQAIKKIVTGMCLRPNFQLVYENDETADIVDNLFFNVANFKETKIVDFKKIDGTHPYDTANIEMLRNLFPFFTSISQDSSPSLFFHLPLPEYLLHGIRLFLNGNMTSEVLDAYAEIYSNHASTLRQNLLQKLENTKIHFSSPLDALVKNAILPDVSFTHQFFQDLGIPLHCQDEFDRSIERKVADVVLEYLKEQPGVAGVAWQRISEQAAEDEEDLSLNCISKWSNSVQLALQSFGSSRGEVALVDDAYEMRLVQVFKKYIQIDSWPSVHCFHWLMPVGMSSVSSLFYLPVNPNGVPFFDTDIEEMIRRSSIRVSTHGTCE